VVQRVNIDLDKELWRQVGIKAAEESITKRELTEKALKNYLEGEAGVRYSVYYKDETLREVSLGEELTEKEAVALAEKHADKGHVFVRFYRQSDGQVGYLNPDGNHDITGKAW